MAKGVGATVLLVHESAYKRVPPTRQPTHLRPPWPGGRGPRGELGRRRWPLTQAAMCWETPRERGAQAAVAASESGRGLPADDPRPWPAPQGPAGRAAPAGAGGAGAARAAEA